MVYTSPCSNSKSTHNYSFADLYQLRVTNTDVKITSIFSSNMNHLQSLKIMPITYNPIMFVMCMNKHCLTLTNKSLKMKYQNNRGIKQRKAQRYSVI